MNRPLPAPQAGLVSGAVSPSAVIGVPDGTRGEMVVAFVTAADPANPPDAADLRTFCRDRLAGYKIPRQFEVVPELPTGPTGKILKRYLRRREEEPGFPRKGS